LRNSRRVDFCSTRRKVLKAEAQLWDTTL